jgi:hypothetical protein
MSSSRMAQPSFALLSVLLMLAAALHPHHLRTSFTATALPVFDPHNHILLALRTQTCNVFCIAFLIAFYNRSSQFPSSCYL